MTEERDQQITAFSLVIPEDRETPHLEGETTISQHFSKTAGTLIKQLVNASWHMLIVRYIVLIKTAKEWRRISYQEKCCEKVHLLMCSFEKYARSLRLLFPF